MHAVHPLVRGAVRRSCVAVLASAFLIGPDHALARSIDTDARTGMDAFAAHCFSPFLTADSARKSLGRVNVRYDFYDLDPFSSAAPSPVTNRAATPGTDRRCEVVFDGDFGQVAAQTATRALTGQGIVTEAPLPQTHRGARLPGTMLLAARRLNPNRIAVVHVGTRPVAQGVETFMNVERLTPSASQY